MNMPDLASMPAGRPRVSVVIPAWNAAATLAQTLHSLLAQTCPPDEIIVIDDGSTDGTAAVLAQFGAPVVSYHQANAGLATARKQGVERASGDFIALFDADDLCEPQRLAIQVAYLQATPQVLLVSSDFSAFDEHGPIGTAFSQRYYSAIGRLTAGGKPLYPVAETLDAALAGLAPGLIRTGRGDLYEQIIQGNFVHPPTVMFRRAALALAGNFDPDAGTMCDWDWIMRVARVGQIGFIAADLIRYRVSATQMSSARFAYTRAQATIRILRRLQARDPQAWARHRCVFRRKLGQNCLDAADAVCETDRAAGLRWLLASLLRHRHASRRALSVALRLALPRFAVALIRRRKA